MLIVREPNGRTYIPTLDYRVTQGFKRQSAMSA